MRHLLILYVACIIIVVYENAYFNRNAWPPGHPWSGLAMVLLGVSISLGPRRTDGTPSKRRRLAMVLTVAIGAIWLIDGLMMPPGKP